ncbi:MAG: hypothetical protein OXS28_19675, partial [Gammaproteobacteria bacterium]|nr:hypothetical protein [Gammaproteobacteria bacterium]
MQRSVTFCNAAPDIRFGEARIILHPRRLETREDFSHRFRGEPARRQLHLQFPLGVLAPGEQVQSPLPDYRCLITAQTGVSSAGFAVSACGNAL